MFLKYLLLPICCFISCSASNTPKTETKTEVAKVKIPEQRRGAMRTVEGNKIIRTVDASQLPFSIGEEFTNENQQFILVIENVTKANISAEISTHDKGRNLRINQIILPDNSSDGPFMSKVNYKTSKKGTYKIVIGKNLMTEGKLAGSFSVSVKLK